MMKLYAKDLGLIAIGVSAGGLETLSKLLPMLPEEFPWPIVIVQHIAPDSIGYVSTYFDNKSKLPVKEADEKEQLKAGTIYTAPPGYHLLVEDDESFSLDSDERVNYSRPSINVFFDSALDVYGKHMVAILLTGANSDGADALKRAKQKGAITIVQDPKTAVASVMPQSAIDLKADTYVFNIEQIGEFLSKLAAKYKEGE